MGQTLFDLLNGQNLVLYADDELRQQALSTVSIETPRGWRIAKEKASKKIDAIVALSMACVTAMAHHGDLSSRATRGFNRSLHVSQQKIVPEYGPIYVGQSLEEPSTVIVQAQRGVVCVLTVFASEQMSLHRHLGIIVKPWLIRHTPWALRGRQLFGTYPCDGDQQLPRASAGKSTAPGVRE
jgi:uncharacterized protein YbdZ (MbtH family)